MRSFKINCLFFCCALFGLASGNAQDGNVGVGTQNPTEKLHIYEGNIYIETTNPPTKQPTLIFSNTGNIHAKSGLDIILDSDNSDNTNNSSFYIKRDGEAVILLDVSETGRSAFGKSANNDRVFLDLGAEDSKGFVLPQVSIPNLSNSAPIDGSDAIPNGMLVWNTNTTTGPGLVYWNAPMTRWETVRSTAKPELWVEDAADGELFPATLSHKVGIGTNSPTYDLDVAGNIGLNTYLYHNDNDNTLLHFLNNEIRLQAGGREFLRMNQATSLMTVNNGGTYTDVQFKGGNDNFLLFLDANAAGDKVGIGTNTPSGKLHVKNTDDSYAVYGTSGNLSVYNPETFTGEVRLGAAWNRPGVYSSNQLELFSGNTGLIFGNNNVERMRLTSAGLLGIGINAPAHHLHIYPAANASVKIGNSSSHTDNKLYFGDGAFNWIGEPGVDDRLQLHSSSLAVEIAGNYGADGQVLTSNGTTVYWEDAYPSAPISDCNIVGTYNMPVTVWYGTYGNENSWQLRTGATWGSGVIISGGAGANNTTQYNGSVTLNYGQTYYFEGRDSYGDGWNGGGYFNLGTPISTGNVSVPGYGLTYTFSYQLCANTATRQRIVRGSIQQDGSIAGGGGFDITSIGGGRYEIIFIPGFSDRPSATVTQVFSDFDTNGWGGSTLDNAIITHLDQNKMRVVTGDGSGTATNRDFSFIVIGSE